MLFFHKETQWRKKIFLSQRERERVGRGWGPGVLVSHAAVSHVLLTKAGDESPQ